MSRSGTPTLVEHVIRDPKELKAHHKEFSERAGSAKQDWAIRVHRAISWYTDAMETARNPEVGRKLVEARLLYLWIALGALSNQWDPAEARPMGEGDALRPFTDMLIAMDQNRHLVDCIGKSKATIRLLTANPFLHMDFWRNPLSPALPDKLTRGDAYFDAPLTDSIAAAILRDVLHRIFMQRGQIVHGASTSGSRLNRQTISDCVQFLQKFVPAAINLAICPGIDAEWPPICFPPTDVHDAAQLKRLGSAGRQRSPV